MRYEFPDESESSLLRGAYSCYYCLRDIEPNFGSHNIVGFAILAGHCTEAMLKSHLLQNGVSLQEIKSHEMRHDLDRLWLRGASLAPPVSGEPPEWVKLLNWGHNKPFHYRYIPHQHGMGCPQPSQFLDELFSMLEVLRKKSSQIF